MKKIKKSGQKKHERNLNRKISIKIVLNRNRYTLICYLNQ